MKKTILVLASSLSMFLSACNDSNIEPLILTRNEADCALNISFDEEQGINTKVMGTSLAKESKIQNVQIFVFRKDTDGAIDASKYESVKEGATFDRMELNCTSGEREIWAIVNSSKDYTSDPAIGNKKTLLAQLATLDQLAPDKLLMIGSVSKSLNPGSANATVPVKRTCAAVVLCSIVNKMESLYYQQAGRFTIKDIYLVNVPAKINLEQSMAASSLADTDWWAKMNVEKKALIYDGNSYPLAYNAEYKESHVFYSFPNNCESKTGGSWSPRATRLVIEAEYDDGTGSKKLCYYPITLSKLEANKRYEVKLTIKRIGSTSPDKPVEFNSLSGLIEVVDWASGTVYDEVI